MGAEVSHDTPAGAPSGPPPPGQLRAAVVVIWLEAAALVVGAAVLLVKTVTGHPKDLGLALFAVAFAAGSGWGLAAAGRALLRLNPAVRAPVVVVQLLALPVAYSLGFQAGRIGYGAPIMLAALVTLFLLFTPPVRAVLDRQIGA